MQPNWIKAIRFEKPDAIPMLFHINDACWQAYPQEALLELMEGHPDLFPDFRRPALPYVPQYAAVARRDVPYTDDFGCVWKTTMDGIVGTVVEHPLADWANWESYRGPDPSRVMGIGPIDWEAEAQAVRRARERDGFCQGGLRHGHTFLQLCDIRGYQNLLYDMADGEERLWELIELVEQFNLEIVRRYVAMGVDMMGYPEDLGSQRGPMLSPAMFRTYIQPSYRRLMRPALEAGIGIHMHSDGDIRALCDDLIDSGVQVINLQDLVNGIDWIASRFRGKICVDLDIDRQKITPLGTPRQIDALSRREVEAISTPQGVLCMTYGLYPGVPLENVRALMDAMERYMCYWS